ncbi:Oxysterol-binding protein 1 [Sarcoptes scabiei]|uniref:Oxysterol-binding protein 1 n=2 Tax=Sarcoptes scabiei TaxID=52283 RepID=A0A834R2C4_SARSC|nr:Oxysterol-binding protein 1 [Sarcoptes scabiei]
MMICCSEVVHKKGLALQRVLSELEKMENPSEILSKTKEINERAIHYRLKITHMINSSVEYYTVAQTYNQKMGKILQHESQTKVILQDLIEQLATQQSHLEERAIKQQNMSNLMSRRDHQRSDLDQIEDEEFYDAQEHTTSTEFVVTFPGKAHRIYSTVSSTDQNDLVPKNHDLILKNDDKQETLDSELRIGTIDHKSSSPMDNSALEMSKSISKDESTEEDLPDDDINSLSEDTEQNGFEIDVVTRKSICYDKDESNTKIENKTANNKQSDDNLDDSCDVSDDQRPKTLLLKSDGDDQSLSTSLSTTVKSNSRQRRTSIPVRPNHSLNLWSIMKNCIGKELTKIPMPVNFNEPLSMLQRMTEEFEYADLLHKAAKIADPLEQMVFVAVFSITCYATTSNRTNKPFNPLLGETYECDRSDDLGWRCISEQVSHHPPMLAQYCDSKDWICWREFAMTSKFRGKYLLINPLDITHLIFPASGNHYTWRKVNTTVNNIIVGKLWVDNHGEMTITNHKTGDICHLNFVAYSYFSRDIPRKVTGLVVSKDEKIKWVLNGTWDNKMEACKVVNTKQLISKNSKPLVETGTPKLIWKRRMQPAKCEKMYNMTELAIQLNEPEENVAPTDSRLRPDQRLMEEGKWDDANIVKNKLEEKQRATRRKREEEAETRATEGQPYVPYEPVWFKKTVDPITGNPVHMFTEEYWACKARQDWSRCPNIFLDN